MGGPIEFPKNYHMYMKEAMACLQSHDYEKAVNYLEKAYQLKKDDQLNILLVTAMLQSGYPKQALALAEEKLSYYEAYEKRMLIFVELLIENGQFLRAKRYINDYLKRGLKGYKESWNKLDEELASRSDEVRNQKKQREDEVMKELFSLASLTPEEQFAIVDQAEALPTDKLKAVAPSVFTNPYVHALARSSLLSVLIERQDTEEYVYEWFGELKTIKPNQFVPFEEHPRVLFIIQSVSNQLEQKPSLMEHVMSEVKLILLIAYPFIDEVIAKGKEQMWIDSIISSIDHSHELKVAVSDEDSQIIHDWKMKIYKVIQ